MFIVFDTVNLYICIYDLFHTLLSLWHTYGPVECMCVCMYVCMYVYVCMHYVCVCVCEYVCVCTPKLQVLPTEFVHVTLPVPTNWRRLLDFQKLPGSLGFGSTITYLKSVQ